MYLSLIGASFRYIYVLYAEFIENGVLHIMLNFILYFNSNFLMFEKFFLVRYLSLGFQILKTNAFYVCLKITLKLFFFKIDSRPLGWNS